MIFMKEWEYVVLSVGWLTMGVVWTLIIMGVIK
jgi:hypothetical protein